VSNEAEPVETRSGEVSSLVSEKQVAELPLNGRNYAQLVLMVPGVSPTNDNFTTRGTGLDSFVGASVNGNSSNQNLWTVDGVNNMDVGSNQTLLVYPSIDSIQEFRVERNSFSAEFGRHREPSSISSPKAALISSTARPLSFCVMTYWMLMISFLTGQANLRLRCVTATSASTSTGLSRRIGPSSSGQKSGGANGAVWCVVPEFRLRQRKWRLQRSSNRSAAA